MSFFSEEDAERYALIFTGPMLLLGLLSGTGAWVAFKGQIATAWLVQRHILVSREEAVIPILDAGLDVARVVLLASVLFLVLWAAIASVRRQRTRA